MINIGKESELAPLEVIEKAKDFFGQSRLQMTLIDRGACCIRFEGTGGYVFVQATELDDREGSDVSVEGREFEHPIRQFMKELWDRCQPSYHPQGRGWPKRNERS